MMTETEIHFTNNIILLISRITVKFFSKVRRFPLDINEFAEQTL